MKLQRPPAWRLTLLLLILAALALAWAMKQRAAQAPHNGFELSHSSIDPALILKGGPGKDGIPALDHPDTVSAQQADYLKDSDRIIGIQVGDTARAYPIRILNWHELVNDRLGDKELLISYCPLCGSAIVFQLPETDRAQGFGVSGLLYNSNLLLYDRASESLWSQIQGRAISGPRRGEQLTPLPIQIQSWGQWRQQHPNTDVLSKHTGYWRDYQRDPYDNYAQIRRLYFPVEHSVSENLQGLHPKAPILGLTANGRARAWPLAAIKQAKLPIHDWLGDKAITLSYQADSGSVQILDHQGQPLAPVRSYWFTWYAFYPNTSVYPSTQGRDAIPAPRPESER